MDASLLLGNLLTPPILLFSIGMHGGVELSTGGLQPSVLLPLGAGVLAGALVPLAAFAVLRRRVGPEDAAAIAATYGSISAVTFITATSFLDVQGVQYGGHMVAAMALMESPAILVGVLLARRFGSSQSGGSGGQSWGTLLREAVLNGPVFLLLGSLVVGFVTGEEGWAAVRPFAHEPFRGVLCLFLLDMGLVAARRLDALRRLGTFLVGFALVLPQVNAVLAIAAAALMRLSVGDALLFTVLCASASYIAVPAAMRVAVPRANASLYLPMSLALTFPFNIALGIPLYYAVIVTVWSGT